MAFSGFPSVFLQGSISALLTSSAAWALLWLARRRWPGLDARRTPWLLAQLAGAATLVLVMLPVSAHLSMLVVAPAPSMEAASHAFTDRVTVFLPQEVHGLSDGSMIVVLAWSWLGVYLLGLAWTACRRRRVRRTLRMLLSLADPLEGPALRAHAALAPHQGDLPPVREIDAPVSAMLVGVLRPVLLLPRHMRDLPPAQQGLIVAHELMHVRRRDHLWQHAGASLQLLLWFVPFVHSFHERLQGALELGCDAAVLAGRSSSERRSYAAALLTQLAAQVHPGHGGVSCSTPGALAFGSRGAQALAHRIRLIRDAQPVAHTRLASATVLLLLPVLCGATILLQPQFARDAYTETPSAASGHPGVHAAAPAAGEWRAPLARLRVTSDFGAINRPGGKPHKGMDFGAPRGTAVLAPADGRIVTSSDHYDLGSRYGKVVVVAHADGRRSLYAHLDKRLVEAGETVKAGQRIALSGATGKVSGPHLHFEVSHGGALIDPQAVLGDALAQAASVK
ncbi:MAG: M56 family metallopeptidase [Janthinobacterium lividum]